VFVSCLNQVTPDGAGWKFILVIFLVEFKTEHGDSVKSACSVEFDDGNYWEM
jgi:hypothetical protein